MLAKMADWTDEPVGMYWTGEIHRYEDDWVYVGNKERKESYDTWVSDLGK